MPVNTLIKHFATYTYPVTNSINYLSLRKRLIDIFREEGIKDIISTPDSIGFKVSFFRFGRRRFNAFNGVSEFKVVIDKTREDSITLTYQVNFRSLFIVYGIWFLFMATYILSENFRSIFSGTATPLKYLDWFLVIIPLPLLFLSKHLKIKQYTLFFERLCD